MDQRLTRRLLGQDPRNVDNLFTDMMHSISASGFYQGAVMSAISGIEMALWDITGQDLGCPIWQLLGGKFRDRIRLYNDCHEGEEDTPEGGVETAKAFEARGFDAIKFDIDPRPSRRDAYNRTISNNDIDHFVRASWQPCERPWIPTRTSSSTPTGSMRRLTSSRSRRLSNR